MASPQGGGPSNVQAGAGVRDRFRSLRTRDFTESVIREMTRLAKRHGAVNLAQGFPDFSAPEELKQAAREAITNDFNQYAITWGAKSLRDAIAAKYRRTYGLDIIEGNIASGVVRLRFRSNGKLLKVNSQVIA